MNLSRYVAIAYLLVISNLYLTSTAKNTVRLWYTQPAANWNEALPVGNGRLGAMVFGDCVHERIQLNEESIWAGKPVQTDADARGFLPIIQQKILNGNIKEALQLSEEKL